MQQHKSCTPEQQTSCPPNQTRHCAGSSSMRQQQHAAAAGSQAGRNSHGPQTRPASALGWPASRVFRRRQSWWRSWCCVPGAPGCKARLLTGGGREEGVEEGLHTAGHINLAAHSWPVGPRGMQAAVLADPLECACTAFGRNLNALCTPNTRTAAVGVEVHLRGERVGGKLCLWPLIIPCSVHQAQLQRGRHMQQAASCERMHGVSLQQLMHGAPRCASHTQACS